MIDRTEIAFIDLNVSDIDTLIAGFRPEVDWVRLDQSEPAPRQIARALDGRNGLAAIHVIAHGAPGEVSFGAGTLSLDSIDEQAGDLGTIGTALGERGALMLWSCHSGQGEAGQDFIDALASASGVQVAAATRLVGAAARGGSWELDAGCVALQARSPLTAAGALAYAGVMVVVPPPPPPAPSITSVTDDVPPVTGTLTSGASTNDGNLTVNVSLSGTGAVSGNTIQLYNGTGTGSQLGTSYILTPTDITNGFANVPTGGLSSGTTYVITARITVAGTQSAVSTNSFTVTEDQSTPSSPSTPVLAAASDSGASSTDKLTNVTTPTFTGTAEANSTVKLFDNGTQVGSVVADGSGNWSITSSVLSQGTHNSITATATDAAGNASGASGGSTVTIDTTALPPGTPDLQAASDTGPSTTDNVTKVTTPTFSGTGVEANSTVTLFDGATKIGSAAADGSGIWNVTSTTLGQGTHNITATQTDLAGNVSAASTALSVTIDTTAPTVSTVTASPATADLGAGKTVTLTFGLSETVTVVGTPTLSLNTGNNGVATYVSGSGTNTLTFGYTVRAGDNSADLAVNSTSIGGSNASITDTAGNAIDLTGALANPAGTLQIDTVAPAQPSTLILAPASDGGLKGDNRTNINTPSFSGKAEAGSTVTIFNGGTAVGSGVADGSGNYNVATSALTDGSHGITATATDGAGNVSGLSNLINVTIDSIAPTVSVTGISPDTGISSSDGITNAGTVTVSGTVDLADKGLAVTVLRNGTSIGTATVDQATGVWTLASVALSNGANTLTARATDVAGNTGTSNSFTATNDTTALAPSTPDLLTASDSGSSSTDNITNITTPTFTGTAEIGSTVTLFDGATQLGSVVADGSGNWNVTTSVLSPGAHVFTAKQTDLAGNNSVASAALNVTLDTTAPLAPAALVLAPVSDSGVQGDNITNVTTPTFTGTAEANSTVKLFDGASQVGTAIADGSGKWSVTSAALSQGAHTAITATATDVAGNASVASSGLSVTIDSIAPTVSVTAISPDTGISSSDGITNAGTVTVSGTVDLADKGLTVTVLRNGTSIGTATVDQATGVWTLASVALSNGANTLTARATDVAGNTGTSNSFTATNDTTALAPSTPDLLTASDSGSSSTDNITNITTPTFTGTAEIGSTVTLFDGATQLGSVVADGSGNWNVTTSVLSPGAHVFTAKQTDLAGNNSVASAALNVTLDTTAPLAPAALVLAPVSDSGVQGDNITNVTTPTFTGTAEANSTVKLFDGASQVGTAIADGSGKWSVTSAALSQGAHTAITATATDVAGNASVASSGLSVTIDTTAPAAPTIGAIGGLDGEVSGQPGDNTVSGTAEAGATVAVRSGANTLGTATADGGGNWIYALSPANLTTLGQGGQTVTATATDPAGNTSGAAAPFSFSVDTVAPSVPVLSTVGGVDGVVSGQAGDNTVSGTAEAGATVTVRSGGNTLGTATADSGGNWIYALSPANLATLGQGSQTATATATDTAGNTSGATAPFSFGVDTVAPSVPVLSTVGGVDGVVSGQAGDNTVSGTAEAGATVTVRSGGNTLGTATADGFGNWTYALSPANLTTLGQGSQTATATATDTAGNTSGATTPFSFSVDTAAPSTPVVIAVGGADSVVSGQAGDNTVSGTAEVGATVTVRSGASTLGTATADGGGSWSYALTAANLTTLGQGSQTATATATDTAGNTSSATAPFGFSVDNVAPSTPSIISVTDDVSPGTGPLASGVSTNDTDLTVQVSVATTDAVAGDTIQLFNGTGTGSPLGSYTLLPSDITSGVANVQTGVLATPGAYDITARLIDQAGNLSGASSLFTVTEDANAVCFSAGTHILTASGERIVESLMQGDIVLTLSGEQLTAQPVKWIGRRRIDLTAHPHPETVAPIRIQRSAFADNMPHSDLLVSPDHAVFVDGKLICARQLVNGSTIHQEKGWASVEYFHVELDSHAILLAEGLPAESYLDTGNHGFFINSGEPLVLHPDLTDETDYPAREAGSCAPFVSDEASVLPVWQRLAKRAAALGQPAPKLDTTDDPELRIVAKGRMVRPVYSENGRHVFVLPKGATEVRLISRAGSPTDVRPWLDDRRCLGVNVERIVLRGASELQEVPVDHPGLAQGWHAVERDGVTLRRWTSGDAVLPLPALAGPIMLEIRANNGGMGYVVEVDATEEVTRKAA